MTYTDEVRQAMLGRVFESVANVGGEVLVFQEADGTKYVFYHSQDCCESVSIEDIDGGLDILTGSPLLVADEETSNHNPPDVTKEYQDSFTWTFYKFATAKGRVTVRWYGESNGYYSESVDARIERPAG